MSVFSAESLACVCADVGFSDSQAKAYNSKRKFNGAIFTGRITNIKDLSERDEVGDGLWFPLTELEIEVEQFWFGVNEPRVKVLTLGPNTSCTVEWERNRPLFFIASRTERGLSVGSCDLVNWKGNYPDNEWAEYSKRILRTPKTLKR